MTGECCRGNSTRAHFVFLDVHALDETVRDGVDVPDLAIRKDIATNGLHDLMNSDFGRTVLTVDHLKGLYVRIELLPLAGPVGANLFFPDDPPALRCLGPADVLAHQREGVVDIPIVERGV